MGFMTLPAMAQEAVTYPFNGSFGDATFAVPRGGNPLAAAKDGAARVLREPLIHRPVGAREVGE